MEQEYAREHGSSRTEVRGDGSIAEFSDPAEGFEPDAPVQAGEQGTTVDPVEDPVLDGVEVDEDEEDGA